MQDWVISAIISWIPFFIDHRHGLVVGRQVRRGLVTKDGRSLAEVMAELTDGMKRQNARQTTERKSDQP